MVGPASLRAGGPFKERSPIEAGASTLGYEPGRERKQPVSIQDILFPRTHGFRGGGEEVGWGGGRHHPRMRAQKMPEAPPAIRTPSKSSAGHVFVSQKTISGDELAKRKEKA